MSSSRKAAIPFMTAVQGRVLALLAILLLALNLRPALAGISPLLDAIQATTGISGTVAGLLTTLPILAMGLCALMGEALNARLGERAGIALGVALIAVACAWRFVTPGAEGLLLSALVAGGGIAIVQSLIPYVIKRGFPEDPGRITGLYVTAIMAGAALGSALSPPLAERFGWGVALGLWALPAVAALALWHPAARRFRTSRARRRGSGSRRDRSGRDRTGPGKIRQEAGPAPARMTHALSPASLWPSLRTWELVVFFGLGTGAFTLLLAWLPPYFTAMGWSPVASGLMLSGVTLTEVCAGLAVSTFIGRFPDRRGPLLFVLTSLLAGLTLLILAPEWTVAVCILLGLGVGSLFPLTLIVTIDHRDDPREAGALAAAVQGGGYIIAAAFPLLAGMLRDHFNDLTHAWVAMGVGVVVMMLMTLRLSPASYRQAASTRPGKASAG